MKKILIRLLIILFIIGILLGITFFGYTYYQNNQNQDIKNKFYKYILENNLDSIFDYSLEEKIISKIKNESFNSKTKMEFSNSFKNNYNFDIDKLTIDSNFQSDVINQKNSIKFNYSNNELFTLDIIQNNKYIAIKNSDVLNNYIGINKKSTKNILNSLNPNINNIYNNMKKYNISNDLGINENSIFSNSNNDYLISIEKYIKSNKFTDEGSILIEQNGEKVEANKYSLLITKQELLNVYSVLTDMFVEDEYIINTMLYNKLDDDNEIGDFKSNLDFNNVVVEEQEEIHALRGEADSRNNQNTSGESYSNNSIGDWEVLSKLSDLAEIGNNKINDLSDYSDLVNGIKCTISCFTGFSFYSNEEELKHDLNEIFENINEFFIDNIDDNSDIKIITYTSNEKTLKTSLLLGENAEISIDYINPIENKYQTVISFLENNEDNKNNGYTITLTKNKTNAIDNNIIEVKIIKDSEVVSKIDFKLNVEGTQNSNKYNTKMDFSFSGTEGKFTTNISNELIFSNQDVYEINSDNTLLIDDLEDNDFYYLVNKLNSGIDKLYNEKVSKLNLINTNISDKILQSNEQENTESENEDEKNKIIDLLIENISNEMGRAQNEGREYSIQDLKNLTIDGYDVQVSVSNEIAIIKVGSYSFKIDKDFNLSD